MTAFIQIITAHSIPIVNHQRCMCFKSILSRSINRSHSMHFNGRNSNVNDKIYHHTHFKRHQWTNWDFNEPTIKMNFNFTHSVNTTYNGTVQKGSHCSVFLCEIGDLKKGYRKHFKQSLKQMECNTVLFSLVMFKSPF